MSLKTENSLNLWINLCALFIKDTTPLELRGAGTIYIYKLILKNKDIF
jgi:hypothetical protein